MTTQVEELQARIAQLEAEQIVLAQVAVVLLRVAADEGRPDLFKKVRDACDAARKPKT